MEWMKDYVYDEEEIKVEAGQGARTVTMG